MKHRPALDPDFVPAVLWNRSYAAKAAKTTGSKPLAISLERGDSTVSVYRTTVLPHTAENRALNIRYVERLVKFLLWQRGGYRVRIAGDPEIARQIRAIYSPGGGRAFDHEFMGRKVYGRPMEVEACEWADMPEPRELSIPLGRNLDGCRIGFDLGGSDRKCAALVDGNVVFSEEIRWDPYFQSDPQYHYDGIRKTLRRAAEHLPRVDAIGGSAAGVYVNNEVRVASLFRGVSEDDFEKRVRRMFFDLQKEWGGIPFEVVIRVRMGLHTGPAEFRDNDYFGGTLNRAARISSAGHGGQVLCSQAAADLLRGETPEVGFVALGDFRLRNLNRVERIYQVQARGLPVSFPPLRSQQNLPHNLPAAQTSFVGRAGDIEQVRELLGKTRVLTLLGTGGTGKTRLAIEVGRELMDDFPDGVWLVELATLENDSSLADAVADTLGVREEPGCPLRETLATFLCRREMLLILDNCEHIMDSVPREVAALVAGCKAVRVLATSRQALRIAGEVTFPVRPLEAFDLTRRPKDRLLSAGDIARFDAVKLFVDRAQSVVPDFRLTDENAPDIARICWRLDGIPLALELAAARLRVLTPAQISARLNDQFKLLKGTAVLPHQQTLRALIDWSYDLLTEPEKLLFHRLGVFVGGRTIEAVEAVCTDGSVDDVLDLLQQLADKSLLFIDRDSPAGPRYTLLESVWQYAREKLKESGGMEDMQERHLHYYLQLVSDAVPHLTGPDPESHLRKLSSESLNLRYALEWAAQRPGGAEPGLQLVAGMERYWEICGNLEEARRHCDAALARPDCSEFPHRHAHAMVSAGRIAWTHDRYGEGRALLDRAIGIFEKLGDDEMAGFAGGYEGFLAFSQGDRELARRLFGKAAEIGKRTGNRRLQALAVAGEGSLAAGEGNLGLAFELKSRALDMFREIGDRWIVGYSLWGLAQAALALGRPAPAREALAEWARIARELGNKWAIPYIIQHLADAARLEGKADLAARLFGSAEQQREKSGVRLSPSEQAACDASVAALKNLIDVEAFLTHWKAGRHLRPEAALELALAG